jgi:transcriptional regulator with GAF, ATPase, and Fis domain
MTSGNDPTTLRLNDTEADERPMSLWIAWAGLGAAPPLRLGSSRVVLGRSEQAGQRLVFPGVSRGHAELTQQGPLYCVRDLGSTNGTYLNGQRIEVGALGAGDVLRLGDAVGIVTRLDDALCPPRTVETVGGILFGPGLLGLYDVLSRVAATTLPVVLEGATGVGKEGLVRFLHTRSGRHGPLQAVNCGALPPTLAEAELFGHRKGAFTGADQAGLGHIRAAHGGTLFLDELYDLSLPLQAKLLRVLQEKEVVPLGETKPVSVDVRVVGASPIPLRELVASGRMREDLAARLSGVVLTVPTLRERRVDIPVFLEHFLRRHTGGRPPAVDGRLLEYLVLKDWPGNVRELELFVRRILVLHGHEPVLKRAHLDMEPPQRLATPAPSSTPPPASPLHASAAPARRASPEQAESDLRALRERLAEHGNFSRAAQEAGISRQRAYRLLAAHPELKGEPHDD